VNPSRAEVPERCLSELADLELTAEVAEAVLRGNAERILS
jgi:hypothetical protein